MRHLVVSLDYVVFSVQACSDAGLALSEDPGVTDTKTVEVMLGISSNSRSVIREQISGTELDSAETQELLNCEETRYGKSGINFAI